ncbi:hypothetical protein KP509_12G066100 [Ceratopteris richardii]|uniref:F-box domain-containing protein n=1 Tax=Ceratopteris richardii TaxID=49495 RepID=A0A8T2TQC4_CERRI|nr:hypothetical protein KP509_12G066100 [Ceratopteris richardii]
MEQLPESVHLLIFSKLNALDVIRAALSCRSLRALAISAADLIPGSLVMSFLRKDSRGFPYFWAHDPSRNAWLSLPLVFLDSSAMCNWKFLPSDGGLVCMEDSRLINPKSDNYAIEQAIIVFNSITGSRKLIPYPRKRVHRQAFGIKHISVSDGYELFALIKCSVRSYTVLRYAALASAWRSMASFSVAQGLHLEHRTIVCCNSVLFTLWKKENALKWTRENNMKLFSLDGCALNEVQLPY